MAEEIGFGELGATAPYYFSPRSIPMLPSLNLNDEEKGLVALLQARSQFFRGRMLLCDSYYRGMQVINDLGISVPPELAGLRTTVAWPRLAVDPIVERLRHDGFRLPGETDADQDLLDVFRLNGWDGEQSLAYTDAKVFGRSFVTVGSPLEKGDVPVICVESPLNMAVSWDARTGRVKAAMQSYWQDDRRHAAVMLPNQTIQMAQGDDYVWSVVDRDPHGFGRVPVVRLANQPRANFRDGYSAITPELMSITDMACRTLLNLDVAGQFYSVPQKAILGASEADFQNSDGTAKTAWETYVSHIVALERDENGELPQLHQFQAYDPSVYTKVLEQLASQASGLLGLPPQYLGLYTQGNPISAEGAQVAESRLDRQAVRDQGVFGRDLREIAQLSLMFMNNGTLPEAARRLEVDWAEPSMMSMSQASDAIAKQIEAGYLPARSDVTGKRLGYNAVERQRIESDRALDQGQSFLQEIAHNLDAKAFRADKSLTADATTAPTPNAMPKKVPVNGGSGSNAG